MNRCRRAESFGRFAILLFCCCFVSVQLFAQTRRAGEVAHSDGALTGFVFADTYGVVTLGRSATPPDGTLAVIHATVSVGSTTTKTDDAGAFMLTGIPAGLGTLHVTTAKGPTGDFPVTIFGGTTAKLGPPPVTRAAALKAVLKALATVATDPKGTIIIGPQEPLPAGTAVAPAFGDDNGQPIYTTRSEQWFIYVDPELFYRYPHPVSFFFVDASTAALNKLDKTSWPTINGLGYYGNHDTNVKSPDLMAGPTIPSGPKPSASNVGRPPLTVVLRNTRYEESGSTLERAGRSVGGRILLTSLLSEPEASSRSRFHYAPRIPQPQATGSTYLLNIQGANESDQVADHSNITQIFGQGGIPPIKDEKDSTPGDPAVPNTEGARSKDVEAKFQQLCTEAGPNDTLFVYITAHGQVARRDGVQLDTNAVNNNGDPVVFDSLASSRFNFSNCKAGHVIFLIDACYSGAFAAGLNKSLSTTGLNYTIISSTDSTHESAYVPSWYHGGYSVLAPGGFWTAPPTGGVFTNTFISAFSSQLAGNSGGTIDLKQVFNSTANQTGSWWLPGIAGIAEQHPFFLSGTGTLAQVTAGNSTPDNKTAPPQPAQPQIPIPPAPPLPPPLPPLTPGKPVPIAARLPLPKCWPRGTNVKAACKSWLDIAERNQLAADVAGRALANADSDLAQADRLDALATQWDDHAKSLANASADYEAMSQSDRQKAGSSSSTDSAVQWENLANQAQAQSKTLSDQAAQAQAQADAIRGEAKALRDNVAAEKADEAAKKAAAAASWQDYNDCLKLPECPQNGQPVTTPPVETGSTPPTPSSTPTTPSSTPSIPSTPTDTPMTPAAPQGPVTTPGDTGKPSGQQGNPGGGAAPGGSAVPGNCPTVETPPFDDSAPWLPPLPEVGPPPEVPECGDPSQCAALLQYAQFLEVVAKLASERAANAEGYLKDAASLDRQAQAENDSASKYEAEASNYDALEAQSRSKAGSAPTTQSAVAWEAIANDEAAQARCYRAQAQEFRDYAAKLTNKANAIRDTVAKAKADAENAEQAASAAQIAYQECLKRPPCPQPTETTPAETPPDDETNQPSDMGGGPPPDSGAGGEQPTDEGTDPGADVDPDSYMVEPDTPDAENPDDSAPIVARIQIVLTANGVQITVVKNNPVPAHDEAIFSLANDSFLETATEPINRAKGPYLPAVYHPDENDRELAPGTIVRVVRSSSFGASATEKNGRKYSLVANGASSGEGLELQVLDPSGKVKKVAMPEGVALEPLERSSRRPVAENAPKGADVVTKPVTIYCAEFSKAPPEPGMQYRIAPQAIQQTYAPAKPVLRAGRELAAAGKLHPDSDPKAYVDSIRQYALWTKLEGWDQKKFGDMFVERTKKNAEALHVKWTPQMENALRGAVPGRWNDISQVLQRADQISKAKQTKRKAGAH